MSNSSIFVRFDRVGLVSDGSTLTMDLLGGNSLAISGKNGSGKSRFLAAIGGQNKQFVGQIETSSRVFLATSGCVPSRQKLATFARPPGTSASSSAEALVTAGLWDQRDGHAAQLTPGQTAAAELLPILGGSAAIALVDGQLDLLDPLTLDAVWMRLEKLMNQGMILIVVTNSMETMKQCDALAILRAGQFRFAGGLDQLGQYMRPTEFTVVTEKQLGVRALVEPFAVRIETTKDGLRFQAFEGQERAVRLLLEGYGDIQYVTTLPGNLSDALRQLM